MVRAVRAINKNTGPCSVSFTLKVIFIMSIPNFNVGTNHVLSSFLNVSFFRDCTTNYIRMYIYIF